MVVFGKEEKKVQYLELIYDLIFVYMVGRDNALIESVHSGFIEPYAFAAYVCCTLSIIQIWNFTTFYINMFGRNGVRDHVFMLVNMYLLYFLGEATRLNAAPYVAQYHTAWGLILINLSLQYAIELRNHRADVWNRDIIRRMSVVLAIEAALVLTAGALPSIPSMTVSYAAIFAGMLLVMLSRRGVVGGQVDFSHLSERAMLYVVFSFGEMVIAVAGYFADDGTPDASTMYYSMFAFLIVVGLFLSYEIMYDFLLDREGGYNGLFYILLHIFLIFAMNNVTVSLSFMREETVALLPKVLFLSVSLAAYFLFLFLMGGHFKTRCHLDVRFIVRMSVLTGVFIGLMLLLREVMAANILISAVYVFLVDAVLYQMKKKLQNSIAD